MTAFCADVPLIEAVGVQTVRVWLVKSCHAAVEVVGIVEVGYRRSIHIGILKHSAVAADAVAEAVPAGACIDSLAI